MDAMTFIVSKSSQRRIHETVTRKPKKEYRDNLKKSEIILYEFGEYQSKIEVLVENETVWLSQEQMINLFDRTKQNISLHINNCFRENELDRKSTVKEYLTVRQEGNRDVKRTIKLYNLDVIISVGYRIKSQRGTQFRIWATQVLKQHITKGFTVNERRLQELRKSVQLIQSISDSTELATNESREIIKVLSEYTLGLEILDGYDHQRLEVEQINPNSTYRIEYNDAIQAINQLKLKFGGSSLFGQQKDASFKSSISTIDQTFDGNELYPSVEEKAANLLYLVVKNHSFTDGNKRIAAWLFVWYLDKNNHLRSPNGQKKIANNALAALTLMIALSKPEEKDLMIKIIMKSINAQNDASS